MEFCVFAVVSNSRFILSLEMILRMSAVWFATMVLSSFSSLNNLSILTLIVVRSSASSVPNKLLKIDPMASIKPLFCLYCVSSFS